MRLSVSKDFFVLRKVKNEIKTDSDPNQNCFIYFWIPICRYILYITWIIWKIYPPFPFIKHTCPHFLNLQHGNNPFLIGSPTIERAREKIHFRLQSQMFNQFSSNFQSFHRCRDQLYIKNRVIQLHETSCFRVFQCIQALITIGR